MGVQPKHKHLNKPLLFCDCNAAKTKTARKTSRSFNPFQFYIRKILYPHYYSTVAYTLRKVIRHMTSDFNECEVDLDMQMNLLSAAPLQPVSNYDRFIYLSPFTADSNIFLMKMAGFRPFSVRALTMLTIENNH